VAISWWQYLCRSFLLDNGRVTQEKACKKPYQTRYLFCLLVNQMKLCHNARNSVISNTSKFLLSRNRYCPPNNRRRKLLKFAGVHYPKPPRRRNRRSYKTFESHPITGLIKIIHRRSKPFHASSFIKEAAHEKFALLPVLIFGNE